MPSAVQTSFVPIVYAGASPPTVDVGIFAIVVRGVDLKTAGTTTILTVPAGRTFELVSIVVQTTAVTSGGAGTLGFQIKESSGARVMSGAFATGSGTPVANQSVFAIGADVAGAALRSNCTAGNAVQFVLSTSNAGSSAVSGDVYVIGLYVQ